MRVSDEGRVMAFTRTEHEEDAELSEVEQLSDEELVALKNRIAALEKEIINLGATVSR